LSLLEIQKISFAYPSGSNFHLDPTDLRVEKGDLVGLLGPNGAGKSTLLKLMAGLLTSPEGRVLYGGRALGDIPVQESARRMAYVPQSMHFTFPLGVEEIVEMGRHPHLAASNPLEKKTG
jgi:iron complex transport system ATP-binding protein